MEVRIALFGVAGHQITGQIGALTRARLTAVSGVSSEWFEKAQADRPELFADVTYYPDLDSLLAADAADLISFCSSRRAAQAGQCVAALEAGCHVIAEKPLATSISDLDRLATAATSADRQLRAMTTMVYEPVFNGMREVVQSGVLGEIVQVYAMKSYPYHDRRPQDRQVDGGLIMQAGIHAVSFIRHVTGLEFADVQALDTGQGNPQTGDLQMAGVFSSRLESGALATVQCNYCNPPKIGFWGNDQLRIHGTAGMIEAVDGLTRRQLVLGDNPPTDFPDAAPTTQYPQDLVDCILDGTPTLLTQSDSVVNTRVVIRAQESASQGGTRLPVA
jgi:predicted dehydrogenase